MNMLVLLQFSACGLRGQQVKDLGHTTLKLNLET